MKKIARIATGFLFLFEGSALAHHSGAMFDRTKTVTIAGTLKEVQWINPHAWIEVMAAPEGKKSAVLWSFELGGGAGSLRGMGMTRVNPKPGDKVKILGYPLRDGRPGASFIRMIMFDGRIFGVNPATAPKISPNH